MRHQFLVFILGSIFMFALSGCPGPHNDCRCSYCDDSGCWACDCDYCWPVDNEPCTDGVTCDDGFICTDYGCARLCGHTAECGAGEVCLDAGYCGPEEQPDTLCATDDDCGNGHICELGPDGVLICVPGCQSNDDCDEGFVCTSCGRCAPEDNPVCGDSKVFCSTDAECGAKVCTVDNKCGLVCDELEPLCPTGQICVEAECIDDPAPVTPECVFSSHCGDDHVCINAYCHATCTMDDQCGYGEFCDLGVCKADYRPEF